MLWDGGRLLFSQVSFCAWVKKSLKTFQNFLQYEYKCHQDQVHCHYKFLMSYISSLLNCRHFVCLSSIYLCNIVIKWILWFCFNSIFIDILYKTVIFLLISVQFLVIPVSVSRVSFSIIASFLLSNFRKYLFNLSPSWNHFVFALLARQVLHISVLRLHFFV